jgi:hypothetical protein
LRKKKKCGYIEYSIKNTMNNNTQEEDLLLKINSKSDVSEDDPNRREVLWTERQQNLILGWAKKLRGNSAAHGRMGKIMKRRYTMVSLPAILIPVVASSLSNVLQPYPLAMSGAMLVTSIFTGINGFFNYGKLTQQYFEYEYNYNKLANEIDKELSKKKMDRIACDLYLQIVLSEMNRLDSSAPVL